MDAPASFEYAKELVTQVLTLSTGVIALSATFVKDLRTGKVKPDRVFLWGAWTLLLMSILFGVLTLGAMAGALDDAEQGKSGQVAAKFEVAQGKPDATATEPNVAGQRSLDATAAKPDSTQGKPPSIYKQSIANYGKIQVGLFFVGIIGLIIQAARKAASA